MIALKPKKQSLTFIRNGTLKSWDKSAAFAVNPRGILIHRVKHVETIFRGKEKSHHHVHYCRNLQLLSFGLFMILRPN